MGVGDETEPVASAADASATVSFGPELVRRIAGFVARVAAASSRDEGGRRRALASDGEEFVGHRPYRPGEDLRHLDWTLLARADQPFVKVHRASQRESWIVAIDTSASMAVGSPSKLQSAAEAAAAAIGLGLRFGARIEVVAAGDAGTSRVEFTRSGDLGRALAALEGLRASAAGGGLEELLAGEPPLLARLAARARARRVLLLGDFLDVDLGALLGCASGQRRFHVGQVLAPEEWNPALAPAGTRWIDPEAQRGSGPGAARRAGGADLVRYHARFDAFVERLARLARDHRMSHAAWSSAEPFEHHVPAFLR